MSYILKIPFEYQLYAVTVPALRPIAIGKRSWSPLLYNFTKLVIRFGF